MDKPIKDTEILVLTSGLVKWCGVCKMPIFEGEWHCLMPATDLDSKENGYLANCRGCFEAWLDEQEVGND